MLGVPLLLSVALLIFTVVVRWWSRDDPPESAVPEEEFRRLPVPEDDDVAEVRVFGFGPYQSTVIARENQCAVCFALTTTRCSRCKAVRYCSSKCQIAHWRQGHKYECHPQASRVFVREDSSGNVEQSEMYGVDSAESSPMMNDESTINQMRSDVSDSHITTPRLSTVTVDSSDNGTGPNSVSEQNGPVLDIKYPKMFDEEDRNNTSHVRASVKSPSSGLGKSVKKVNKEKLRRNERTKGRPSYSGLSQGFKEHISSEGTVAYDVHHSKYREVPYVDLSLNERQKNPGTPTRGEVKSSNSKNSGGIALPAGNSSSLSRLPHNGFASSLQKVVHHFKTSHSKMPPPGSGVLETLGSDSFKWDAFKRLYSSNEVNLKPFGLINCGNSCYANAVLQCLVYTRPLTLYLLQELHSKECCREGWCFICEFEHLILKAREGHSPLSPVRILSNISHLGHGKEEDAHEFLRYAVETMQSVCLELAGIAGPMSEDITLIGMTFGGYLHSKIKCMKCRNKSEKYERMMDLSVEIDGDIRTLEQALKRFTASEILEGDNKYHCSRCKSYEKAKKKLTVFEAPNILTIVLKRFQARNFTKLNKPVQFPEILNMTPYISGSSDRVPRYNLYGVIVHLDVMNATFSGHYVCYVKNYRDQWFKIDDSMVVSVDVERVLSEEAYMLLYARHSPRPPLTSNPHYAKLVETNLQAAPRRSNVRSDIPKTRRYSSDYNADVSMMQHQSSRNGHIKNPSYLEEWVTHSVESIPMMDSSSEASSLFSNTEEGTCSTPSAIDSASVEDFSDYLFGRGR